MTDTLREGLADELAAADHGRSADLSTEYCRRVYGPIADAAIAFIAAWALEPEQVERAAQHVGSWWWGLERERERYRKDMRDAIAALFEVKP